MIPHPRPFSLLLAALALGGCKLVVGNGLPLDASDQTDQPYDLIMPSDPTVLPDLGPPPCPVPFVGCGGDAVGRWQLTTFCQPNRVVPRGSCPGRYCNMAEAEWIEAFNRDGSFVGSTSPGEDVCVTPAACNATCDGPDCAKNMTGDCVCKEMQSASSTTGTWSTVDTNLTLTVSGLPSTASYCVHGNWLQLGGLFSVYTFRRVQ